MPDTRRADASVRAKYIAARPGRRIDGGGPVSPAPGANASTAVQANVDESLIFITRSHMRYCRA